MRKSYSAEPCQPTADVINGPFNQITNETNRKKLQWNADMVLVTVSPSGKSKNRQQKKLQNQQLVHFRRRWCSLYGLKTVAH